MAGSCDECEAANGHEEWCNLNRAPRYVRPRESRWLAVWPTGNKTSFTLAPGADAAFALKYAQEKLAWFDNRACAMVKPVAVEARAD